MPSLNFILHVVLVEHFKKTAVQNVNKGQKPVVMMVRLTVLT